MMQLEHLRYFLTVAQYGSISQASRLLLLDQPNLSKMIRGLEQECGTKLLERSFRGVKLTEHGQALAQWAQEVLAGWEALLAQFGADVLKQEAALQGRLTISVPINIAGDSFHDAIIGFAEKFPHVAVNVEENSAGETIRLVSANAQAVGILLYFDQLYREKISSELLFFPLQKVEPVIYAAQNSQFAKSHKTTSFGAIIEEPLVIYKPSAAARSPVEELLELYGNYNIAYTVSNVLTFYNVLKKGEHIALGVARKDPLLAAEGLTAIPIRDKICGCITLLIARSAVEDPLVRAFTRHYFASRALPLPEALL